MITEEQKDKLFRKCVEAQRLLKPMPNTIRDDVQQNEADVKKAWLITRNAAFETFPQLKTIYDNIGCDEINNRGLPLEVYAFIHCIEWVECTFMDLFVARFSFINTDSFVEKWGNLFHYEFVELKKLLIQ